MRYLAPEAADSWASPPSALSQDSKYGAYTCGGRAVLTSARAGAAAAVPATAAAAVNVARHKERGRLTWIPSARSRKTIK